MHPARSIVFFTTATGAGYGLLAVLGLFGLLGRLPHDAPTAIAALLVAFGLIGAGLLSSTGHLSHRARAWRAFTQWRSSWLSREAVAAVLTFIPAGAFAFGWVVWNKTGGWVAWAGAFAAIGAVSTVFMTGMIYASLKPVSEWHTPFTVPGYLLYGLMSGLTLLTAILAGAGPMPGSLPLVAAVVSLAGWFFKRATWYYNDRRARLPSANAATGLSGGTIRSVQWPHSARNFLLKEMGFRIARKHSRRLRIIALVLGFSAPAVLLALGEAERAPFAFAVFAAVLQLVGLLVERWLFFAEATHTISLYYGLDSSQARDGEYRP
ncbi:MAG: dimethyl sulfoxide reductase anchor subunit [Alphaproteobacteria bacterium]|nr:dimethyl sulfoxide reductase anchor subunit [Alphaproteobacteria bacterium]